MGTIDLGEDDGLVAVQFGEHSLQLDLYLTHDQLLHIAAECKDKPPEDYYEALAAMLEGLGLPRVSFRTALRFARQVFELVDLLKKKDNPDLGATLPESPGTTTSILSD